jgi:hypothetical protein
VVLLVLFYLTFSLGCNLNTIDCVNHQKIMTIKKTILFALFLFLNCVFATQSTAFVFSKKGEITQIAPPQYPYLKNKTWHLKSIKQMAVTPPTNSAKLTRQAIVTSGIGFGLMAAVFIIGLFFTPLTWLSVLVWLLSIILSIVGIVKARRVLKNPQATDAQKKTARTAQILSIISLILLVLLPALFFIASLRQG